VNVQKLLVALAPPWQHPNPNLSLPSAPRLATEATTAAAELPTHMSSAMVSFLYKPLSLQPCDAARLTQIYHRSNVADMFTSSELSDALTVYSKDVTKWVKHARTRFRHTLDPIRHSVVDCDHTELIDAYASLPIPSRYVNIVERYLPTMSLHGLIKSRQRFPLTNMQLIDKAVRSSLYKDVSTANNVIPGDIIALYKGVIDTCQSPMLRDTAHRALQHLQALWGPSVLSELLKGFRGDGTSIGYVVPANTQSVVVAIAVECVVHDLTYLPNTNISHWVSLSNYAIRCVLSRICADSLLPHVVSY
jgi:hypothetical protein